MEGFRLGDSHFPDCNDSEGCKGYSAGLSLKEADELYAQANQAFLEEIEADRDVRRMGMTPLSDLIIG